VHVHDARVPAVIPTGAPVVAGDGEAPGVGLAWVHVHVPTHVAVHAEQPAARGARALERWWRTDVISAGSESAIG
jgi:hypothetical protein